jgi:hypothetical protein
MLCRRFFGNYGHYGHYELRTAMKKSISAAMFLLCLPGFFGCSSVKWMYTDKATGETWWIKHSPLSADEINYCQPQTNLPGQCFTAELLDSPPPPAPAAIPPP